MGCSLQVSPGRVTCFHLALSSPSSSLSPTVFMFSFTTSINLLFGSSPGRPPACLPVPASASCHWYIHYPSSAHIQSISVWPLLSGFISKTSNRRRPPDVLSPDPIHPARSQQRRSACFIWMSATSSSASCLFLPPPPPPLSLNRTASQPSPPSHALFLSWHSLSANYSWHFSPAIPSCSHLALSSCPLFKCTTQSEHINQSNFWDIDLVG